VHDWSIRDARQLTKFFSALMFDRSHFLRKVHLIEWEYEL